MNLYKNEGACGHHLELAFKYLISTPPTNIETEAYIGNKLKSYWETDIRCFTVSTFIFSKQVIYNYDF